MNRDPARPDQPAFYAAERTYRNARTVRALVICALFAVFPTLATIYGVNGRQHSGPVYYFAVVVCLCFLALFCMALNKVVTNRREAVRIDRDGVTFGGRTHPWSAVTRISYSRQPFSRNGFVAFSTHPAGRISFPLAADRLLTPDDYRELASAVAAYVAKRHPNVRVDDAS